MTTGRETSTRGQSRIKKVLAVTATAVVASAALVVPSWAAVNGPERNYMTALLSKLGAHSRLQALVIAIPPRPRGPRP